MDSTDVGGGGPAAHSPSLEGSRVYLRPVTEADYGFLFALSTDEATGYRWRFRGETPSPEGFTHAIWHNTIAQFASITDLPAFAVEGRLTEHEYYGERYWDVVVVALRREGWQEFMAETRARRAARRERAGRLLAAAEG